MASRILEQHERRTDGARVVGMLDLWPGETNHNCHTGRLGMSVRASYRRTGVGRKLLECAIEEAKKFPNFCQIGLDVVPWNVAVMKVYQAASFARQGTMQKAAIFGDRATDLVLMALVW
jgi:RimJ/RimL family protein N-acetyltransferase